MSDDNKYFATKEEKRERILICEKCPYNKFSVCTKCGCIIPLKTKLKGEACPIGNW